MWLAEPRTDIALRPRQATRCAPLPHNFAYRFNGYSNRPSDSMIGGEVRSANLFSFTICATQYFPILPTKDAKAYLPHIILKSGSWGKRTYLVAYPSMEKARWNGPFLIGDSIEKWRNEGTVRSRIKLQ